MEFLVADAERLFAEGGRVKNLSFWGYKIMTRSTLPSYRSPPLFPKIGGGTVSNFISGDGYTDFCTWHRYSDFEWLVEQLEYAHPGIIVPPIPDKDADGTKDKLSDLMTSKDVDTSRDNDLVQKRIRHLQLFFDNLMILTVVHECEALKAFLTMEEPEWLAYKERKALEIKPHGWDLVKSKGLGLLSKLSSIGDKKPVAFPEGSVVAGIKKLQQDLGDSMRAAAMHMMYLKKYGHANVDIRQENAIDPVKALEAPARLLPSVLVYNGHFVCDVNDRRRQGVVRHVEGFSAWVDWGIPGEALSRVPLTQLCVPSSGIADPTVFACNEISSQVDSFCTYLGLRPEARQLERLTDLLFFWSKFAHRVIAVIDGLQLQLEELVALEKDVLKKKDGPEKSALAAKAAQQRQRYESGCTTLLTSHSVLRAQQRKVLLDTSFLFGALSTNFLNDDEWDNRLQRADAALPLLFEPPQEVIDTLTQEAKAAHFMEYLPPQQPTPSASAPVPQEHTQPQSFQQQQPYNPAPYQQPVQQPTQPSQQRFRAESFPPAVPTAPPEDTTPPPPPPPQQHQPEVAHTTATEHFVDPEWQAPSQQRWVAEANDSLEPPPPPS